MSVVTRFLTGLIAIVLVLVVLVDASKQTHQKETEIHASRAENALSKRKTTFSGPATWFVPSLHGGSMGACGEYEADDSYVVALNSVQYGDMTKKSSWCGKTIRVHYGGKSVEAVINDACPECRHGAIDLTPPVFNTLGDPDVGILQVKWEVV